MSQARNKFSVGDRVRFVHGPNEADVRAETHVVGEVAGINQGVATIDVMAMLEGRPTFVTKRPWDLEMIAPKDDPDSATDDR